MRSNTARKQQYHKHEAPVARPKSDFLKIVEKQEIEYNGTAGDYYEIDYEEFLSKYGKGSDFA